MKCKSLFAQKFGLMKSWWRSCEITSWKKLPVLYIISVLSSAYILSIIDYHFFPILQLFTAKDQIVVEGFSELLHQTEEREVRINKITKRLNEELMYLSKFLENLATRRPQRKSLHPLPPTQASTMLLQKMVFSLNP